MSKEKNVSFIQYDEPSLESGSYKISFTQEVLLDGNSTHKEKKDFEFFVAGERLIFDPDEFNSIFPPNEGVGTYDKVFPHIVFNRSTLPWERSIGSGIQQAPWLALLLIGEDENPPKMVQGKVQDLLTPPEGVLAHPNFVCESEAHESAESPCYYIDVKREFFQKIAPRKKTLPFLAHIREVDTRDSEDHSEDSIRRSVLICNRIPKGKSHVYLVSLEGMADYLPGEKNASGKETTIRLFAYKSWTFSCSVEGAHFRELLNGLKKNSGSFQYPLQSSQNELSKVATNKGFLPLEHYLRKGGKTASWYRGPLTPYALERSIQTPISCPDQATFYDNQTNLLNVSYGAAWQMGQLLALQSSDFSSAIYNWRKGQAHNQQIDATIKELKGKLENSSLNATSLLDGNRDEGIEEMEKMFDWITRLRLLDGVPYHYLVPHEKMLPEESIRFFYLDPNWVEALVDGALSIGRSISENEESKIEKMRIETVQNMQYIRPQNPQKDTNSGGMKIDKVSGFLLRSELLSFGPRLIVDTSNALLKLKMARLSEDVLMCLFAGEIKDVRLHEPPEGLHFGEKDTENFSNIAEIVDAKNPAHSAAFALSMVKGGASVRFIRK